MSGFVHICLCFVSRRAYQIQLYGMDPGSVEKLMIQELVRVCRDTQFKGPWCDLPACKRKRKHNSPSGLEFLMGDFRPTELKDGSELLTFQRTAVADFLLWLGWRTGEMCMIDLRNDHTDLITGNIPLGQGIADLDLNLGYIVKDNANTSYKTHPFEPAHMMSIRCQWYAIKKMLLPTEQDWLITG